jgi:hypothetical protein
MPTPFMGSKDDLITRIREINRSADGRWLATFEAEALFEYWEHLQLLLEPRGRSSVWRRRGSTPAMTVSR